VRVHPSELVLSSLCTGYFYYSARMRKCHCESDVVSFLVSVQILRHLMQLHS
jgi:hypothetical protein